jgi:hypothetical protein
MSASPAIGDVTQTLEELLVAHQRPHGLFEVSLLSPAEETVEAGMTPRVNLYLYQVLENRTAKNQDWSAVGSGALRYPPLTLDLNYVLTPYADNRVDEHRVLGEAMRVLYDHALLTAADLHGSLGRSIEDLKVDLSALSLEELTRIWFSFSQPYRLSVPYTVRIVFIESSIERPARRVTEKVEDYARRPGS